jgi:uncharacterized DUF497 family protein
MGCMKLFSWSNEKNEWLREHRGVSFEAVLFHIMEGDLLDVIEHPNQSRYAHQKIFIVNIDSYIYMVPFVENDDEIFLKTIIPSRKMTKKYLR